MFDSLLSLASFTTVLLARTPTSDEIWARVAQIIGSTIFSVITVWLVIKVWKGEFLAGDGGDDEKKAKPGGEKKDRKGE